LATYDIGDQVRLQLILKDYNDVLTSGTVVCSVKDPSASVTTPTVTTPATGTYYASVTPTVAGVWYYRFASTGATIAAGEGSFTVSASQFP